MNTKAKSKKSTRHHDPRCGLPSFFLTAGWASQKQLLPRDKNCRIDQLLGTVRIQYWSSGNSGDPILGIKRHLPGCIIDYLHVNGIGVVTGTTHFWLLTV